MSHRDVEQFEGPYWDYSARSQRLEMNVNSYARLIADEVARGDFEWAQRYLPTYAALVAQFDRCNERYREVKDSDFKWIGWH
jgi:hypothetical protein